jgi:ABC-type dipeptide/oligopeptide/nickel transport system permease component
MADKLISAKPGKKIRRYIAAKTTDDRIRELKKALGLDKWQALQLTVARLRN